LRLQNFISRLEAALTSDLTALAVSDGDPHKRLKRNNIFLLSACPVKCEAYFTGAAISTIAQNRSKLQEFQKKFQDQL
jgi:hypothetical protein